jgi:hypothetical protein
VFIQGETVRVPLPEAWSSANVQWRLLDDNAQTIGNGTWKAPTTNGWRALELGDLGIGWYRLEFGASNEQAQAFTTIAVLQRLKAPTPADSPVCVDSAAAWFAQNDPDRQKELASLAALAGVSWVRDRLRWRDVQPQPGGLVGTNTTYDTSAKAHREAGLQVLQVFHDTPAWAREPGTPGGQFAPDLRHVYNLARELAIRFRGRVGAWEPWNEGNVASFGAHTVDQMCSWQKAAYVGYKAGDAKVTVGWNVTAAIPTPAHTHGVLANETWPYFDTYNIHTYDWSHGYAQFWKPAREAAAGRPLWITEADRGTPHLKNPPWYDQSPRLERLKAHWMAQAYASSLFAGASRHFHFVLGNYQEPNGVQFGLLRLDLTPRPAYVALAAVGRSLAGAKALGRWLPGPNAYVYAFLAKPDGEPHDVLVAWAEKEADWDERGVTSAEWKLPPELKAQRVLDYLGRPLEALPARLSSAPIFVFLAPGEAKKLQLEPPPAPAPWRPGSISPIVLQFSAPNITTRKVEDLPWSEGYAYSLPLGEKLDFKIHAYNFAQAPVTVNARALSVPAGWNVSLDDTKLKVESMERSVISGTLSIPKEAAERDGWVVIRADPERAENAVLAFRVLARE